MQEVRKVYSLEELEEAINLLEKEGIEYKANEKKFLHDNVYTTNMLKKEYVILVDEADVQVALNIFSAFYRSHEKDTNFLELLDTNDLIETLIYPDKFSEVDAEESRKILLERGLSNAEIEKRIEEKIIIDNTPQKAKTSVIIAGYILTIGGGILGFAIGWYLYASKAKHTITAKKYKAHDANSRKHGLIIFILGFVFAIFYVIAYGADWWGDYYTTP